MKVTNHIDFRVNLVVATQVALRMQDASLTDYIQHLQSAHYPDDAWEVCNIEGVSMYRNDFIFL